MDLGISGRSAIVCASSRGLGRGCATALAEAGCRVVINGLDQDRLATAAREIHAATGAEIIPISGDISTKECQQEILKACPEPDILVNNNGGPPRKDFRQLDRQAMIDGVCSKHDHPPGTHSGDNRRHG